ncbi:hypothetical protein HOF65_01105 [bacterium]|jgi:hypothetical protein|nr:hypothetical protein [bacterium]MBT3852638.1 hypothetical protein [bacterium]MBT4633411.1 hypothetical protein [bacterium]MBT6778832.1 hypothetical protein [bacterium]
MYTQYAHEYFNSMLLSKLQLLLVQISPRYCQFDLAGEPFHNANPTLLSLYEVNITFQLAVFVQFAVITQLDLR